MATNVVAQDGDKLVYPPPLLFVLAFYYELEYRNADCCVNIKVETSTYDKKNFVNVG